MFEKGVAWGGDDTQPRRNEGILMLMTRDDLPQRISIDPNICFGKPCIRGTRIWVSLIVENLAAGASESEILENYLSLGPEDIMAALAYVAAVKEVSDPR